MIRLVLYISIWLLKGEFIGAFFEYMSYEIPSVYAYLFVS